MIKNVLAGFFILGLMGCSGDPEAPVQQAMPVEIYTVSESEIPNIIELPGRVEAVRVADVRARVTGIVQRRLYEEGSNVRAGQPLFSIDPSELRASTAQVRASLQRARATAANAQAVVDRYRPLVAEQAISRQEYDAAVAASREAQASVAQIKAELDAANLQLGYTTVRAPISGRARSAEVTEGALVSASEATLMTRIEQADRVYVTFAQSSSRVLDVRRGITDGTIVLNENDSAEVELIFEDGTQYPIPGQIDFLDFSVNETTGTVDLRAEFANPSGLLLPGEFVRARIFVGKKKGGFMVPQKAVTISETGGTVMVIDGDGKAAERSVELGAMAGAKWIIESGLKAGDKVIVSNLQKIRAGVPVTAKNSMNVSDSAGTKAAPKTPTAPSASKPKTEAVR
ncbi:efflux RND transporter periplasmic adaptor subunit [Sphingorhabdus sp. YGSMI21]|uniref:efflux RND transporter periplasmic adaptor subunit n=1 Tax=Sphingorhabdus sp. YGSMI21 TaxID=2077182 RepID=UPI000C1F906C|nr:efflux RND transporter periplasmic adaptor subunit [Sphingorhabdus sp. YGSMI21]ATW04706.1 efflux transporter periplasmic adaptor subunit [Sphingorhabdus sp. YGSMI21]